MHFDPLIQHFYETPNPQGKRCEVWCYTNSLSYAIKETVKLHVSSSVEVVSISIFRDGKAKKLVHKADAIRVSFHQLPDTFYATGCDWPVDYEWQLPETLSSGFYLVECTATNNKGEVRQHEAGFFVKPTIGKPTANILLVAATSTWIAYNDWGGYSAYAGHCEEYVAGKSPKLSIHRPWARGFLSLPPNAPRKPHRYEVKPGDIPRYPPIEFAYTRGYSKYYANAGWATYEGPFAKWLEQQGYAVDFITQHDLHYHPEYLEHYPCVLTVGHDEYWTYEMRKAIDHYVEQGGNLARFAGNFCWQIRLEDNGNTQVAYKEDAAEKDPVANTDKKHLLTSVWEDPLVGWNGASTVGLNALWGIYAGVGHIAPRQGGSFTVYRTDHWCLKGTDLCYGDQFGGAAKIFGYEVDGLDYVIKDGLPEPTYKDGAILGTEIIAMGLAGNLEADHKNPGTTLYYATSCTDLEGLARCRYGDTAQESLDKAARGSGMIVNCKKGKGEIFNAGSCEWVSGLIEHDAYTEIITRNVLDRFINTAKQDDQHG